MTNEIRPASTVALCKITTQWPFKILFLKRSEKAAFLPGAYVFPGGRLEKADYEFGQFLARDHSNTKRICGYFTHDVTTVAAHVGAAIRECLEETGLSLLRYSSEDAVPVYYGSTALKNLIDYPKQQKVSPLLDNLWPISWWITPPGEARRYNTWFFLGLIADEAHVQNMDAEISEALWLFPHDALKRHQAQDIFLAPPTRTILERMSITESLEEFLSFVDKPLRPIAPCFVDEEGQKILVLPGDRLHHESQPSRMPLHTRYQF